MYEYLYVCIHDTYLDTHSDSVHETRTLTDPLSFAHKPKSTARAVVKGSPVDSAASAATDVCVAMGYRLIRNKVHRSRVRYVCVCVCVCVSE
jgi:hypothetical protein